MFERHVFEPFFSWLVQQHALAATVLRYYSTASKRLKEAYKDLRFCERGRQIYSQNTAL